MCHLGGQSQIEESDVRERLFESARRAERLAGRQPNDNMAIAFWAPEQYRLHGNGRDKCEPARAAVRQPIIADEYTSWRGFASVADLCSVIDVVDILPRD